MLLRKQRAIYQRCLFFGAVVFLWMVVPKNSYAVVGQAERFDEFREEELNEFHESVLREERKAGGEEVADETDIAEELFMKEELLRAAQGEEKQMIEAEIENLKRELLVFPKKDRFKVELTGTHLYDNNINRNNLRQEKGDSVFTAGATGLFDISGRKTDLRYEAAITRQWNYEFSTKDSWQVENRLRYRRKYFKKLQHSLNAKLTRDNTKTVEIDNNKIRWDSNNQTSFNYALSRKFSANLDLSNTKRLFRQEAFDQDSSWQATAAGAMFWNMTQKSRLSGGYSFGASRARTKSGDSNAHNLKLGYFGQVTRKSSASLDLAYTHQTPRSKDTAISDTVTTGVGFIYQLTPKTQTTIQFTRAMQNTTTNLVSGEEDGENVTSKTDTHFVNDNLNLALNTTLLRTISLNLTLSGSHTQTKTFKDGDKDSETRQFQFPLSTQVSYNISRWASLVVQYTFTYRMGNEKADKYRAHTLQTNLRLIF